VNRSKKRKMTYESTEKRIQVETPHRGEFLMGRLRVNQSKFAKMVGQLIAYAYSLGYELTLGDAMATTGHCKGSFHYKRLAIDLNLFKNGRYLSRTEDHAELGAYWKRIGGTWGGDFKKKDGNHYSYLEKVK